jgi:AraC-like DNA-binding protein
MEQMTARPRSAQIERYDGQDIPHRAIPAMGQSSQTRARPGLLPHVHDVFEICLIDDGAVDWTAESRPVLVPPVSVFLTRPGVVHGSIRGVIEPCTLRWIQIDPRADAAVAALLGQSKHLGRIVWPADARLADLHGQMLRECRRPRPDGPGMLASLLSLFLAILFRCERDSATAHATHPAYARVIRLIESQPGRRWSLNELQAESGVSRARLLQLFNQHMGLSPVAYATRLRLRRAMQRLHETDLPITAIAAELGFASSQHLAGAFRRQFGMTATQCRRSERM